MKNYYNLLMVVFICIAGDGCKKDHPVDQPAKQPIKKVEITTIAGDGTRDYAEGPALSARFAIPEDVVVAPDGTLYITDVLNRRIRKVADGQVSTFAGNAGFDIVNGVGQLAQFKSPFSITVDASGNLYITDENDPRIRKITAGGVVSTYAGGVLEGFVDGKADTALFGNGNSIVADAWGNIYIADSKNNRIRKIDGAGIVSTIAGNSASGYRDGSGTAACFSHPTGITIDGSGNLYVADFGNFRIRKVTPSGVVTSYAGCGEQGDADGEAGMAQFSDMNDLVADGQGNIYLADANRIRMISPQGVVSTVAGSSAGYADGDGTTAKFNFPGGLGIDAQGNIYVADLDNSRIRKISFH